AYMLVRNRPLAALVTAIGFGVLGHAALTAGFAPRLAPLWLSKRVETAMARAELLPRQGVADAPVTVTGYAEPSLVFALGTETELGSPQDAAEAIVEHRPAVVEARKQTAFEQALAADHVMAQQVAEVKGLDYSDGHKMTLRIYKAPANAPPPPGEAQGGGP
ncbi:MAG: glycosyltransferase family 39 protein, partial [Alphaproteobacteria bacterium]|nr:glycosyltransferase family 39 protein [Alphaproteobacteria bacterium]